MSSGVVGPRTTFITSLLLSGIVISLLTVVLPRAEIAQGTPEDVGLSAERLTRINQVIQREIDTRQISGAVTIVARRGQVAHFEAHGLMDIQTGRPMRKDTIFPIASMTKPVTGVA